MSGLLQKQPSRYGRKMNEKTKVRFFLLFFCAVTFLLTIISLTKVNIKEFIVFYCLFAYYFIVMFWEETRSER